MLCQVHFHSPKASRTFVVAVTTKLACSQDPKSCKQRLQKLGPPQSLRIASQVVINRITSHVMAPAHPAISSKTGHVAGWHVKYWYPAYRYRLLALVLNSCGQHSAQMHCSLCLHIYFCHHFQRDSAGNVRAPEVHLLLDLKQ